LDRYGLSGEYSVLTKGQRSGVLIRQGAVDIVQSAVSSNWKVIDNTEFPPPVHFAQINQRDGFYLVCRKPERPFRWRHLEGQSLLADHGLQPLVMLQYAVRTNGTDWTRIHVADAGTPDEMERAFRAGTGDCVHLQGPAAQQLEHEGVGSIAVAVGESIPPVAFSSLCCSREFLQTDTCRSFVDAFRRAREWAHDSDAGEVAQTIAPFFPDVNPGALAAAVRAYQQLGCWAGGVEIPLDLYEQALNVFETVQGITRRFPYDEVCDVSLARSIAPQR
jgi:NitT/TauT family transport system substrate-binding protein